MTRLSVIAVESLNFKKELMEVGEKVKIQLTWIESKSKFPEFLPQKTTEGIKLEMVLLEFCRKDTQRLSNEISKTVEKCEDFYKKIHQVHEKCQIPLVPKITNLPRKDQHLTHL